MTVWNLPGHPALKALFINLHYLGILVYKSHYKSTLPGHPGVQVLL
jgi:hypothetical protein